MAAFQDVNGLKQDSKGLYKTLTYQGRVVEWRIYPVPRDQPFRLDPRCHVWHTHPQLRAEPCGREACVVCKKDKS
jgi:hypothetical protein